MGTSPEQAFLRAFDDYADQLFRHASFRISDRERARDLVQDCFTKAWEYVAGGGEVREYKSFLYRVLHNLIVDEYRRKKPSSLDELLENETLAPAIEAKMASGSARQVEETLDEEALIERVRSKIGELPEAYAAVLTLRFVDDHSIGEIADVLDVSENVISVRIHRGLSKLRALCTNDML